MWHRDVMPSLLLYVGSRCDAVSSASLLLPHPCTVDDVCVGLAEASEVELGRRVGQSMMVNYYIVRCEPPNSPSPAWQASNKININSTDREDNRGKTERSQSQC